MKRFMIAGLLPLLFLGSASAADLPQAPPPQAPAAYIPIVAPVYNWAGFYLGINGGWGFGTAKWTAIGVGATATGSDSDNGGVIGGTLGANWQAGAFVLGAEADFDYSGINTSTSQTICNLGTPIGCQTGNNWLSTVRGRVGFAADRVLFYGTAGGAFANVQTVVNARHYHQHSNRLDRWPGSRMGLYRQLDGQGRIPLRRSWQQGGDLHGRAGVCAPPVAPAAIGFGPVNIQAGLTENLVRVGVNYKFNY